MEAMETLMTLNQVSAEPTALDHIMLMRARAKHPNWELYDPRSVVKSRTERFPIDAADSESLAYLATVISSHIGALNLEVFFPGAPAVQQLEILTKGEFTDGNITNNFVHADHPLLRFTAYTMFVKSLQFHKFFIIVVRQVDKSNEDQTDDELARLVHVHDYFFFDCKPGIGDSPF